MLTGLTIEEAKKRAPKWLWRKMEHSIDLLRKAEKIALIYDKEDGYYLAFSGGKDSQALYHMAELAGVKFKGHINWTSVDPPQVIRFKRKFYPEVVEHKPRKSIYDLAVEKGILPSMRIRWCCAELKESAGAGKVTLIGIRKQESTRRAKRHEVEVSNKAFSGNLDEFGQWQKEQIEKQEAKLIRKMKKEGKKVNEDEFSLTKDNEVRCINGKDSILVSPIFEWTEKDVWTFLNDVVRVPHCELYDHGYKRIGCILCPMSQHRQKIKEMKDFPHVKRGWIRAIKAIRAGGYSREGLCGGICRTTERRAITPPASSGNDTARRNFTKPADGSDKWDVIKSYRNGWVIGIGRTAIQSFEQQLPPPPPTDEQRIVGGFSDNPSLNGDRGGDQEPTEDEIAEKIFNWWISGKAYSQWYADTYLQQHIDFDFDNDEEENDD